MIKTTEGNLKKSIFELLLNNGYKFYMNIHPTEHLIVGKRGVTQEEKEMGLILVFSKTSYRNLKIDEHFIYCDMKFKGIWENLQIPFYAINYMVDDLYNPSFVFRFRLETPPKNISDVTKQTAVRKPNLKIVK